MFLWNIESIQRNIHSLKHFTDFHKPDFVFLSEPQLFQCDAKALFRTLQGQFSYHLNSEDLHHPELALEHQKAKGGTMALWNSSLDPFVSIIPTNSSSVLALSFSPPNLAKSCHICLYLPTSGQEAQFISALSGLDSCIEDINTKFDFPHIFIRGDANVNPKNIPRASLFHHFLDKHQFAQIELHHPTYHHFLGQGEFDSALDVILHSKRKEISEKMKSIICKLVNPLIQSHHDLIVSSFTLPTYIDEQKDEHNVVAPRVANERMKILWAEEGITDYQEAVADHLTRLRNTWCDPSSPALMSILLSSTYSLLTTAASSTNKHIPLGLPTKIKPRQHHEIVALKNDLLKKHKAFNHLKTSTAPDPTQLFSAKQSKCAAKTAYRQAIRAEQRDDAMKRDDIQPSICSSNPKPIFKAVKSARSASSTKIHTLNVKDKVYTGEAVADGFYDSLSALKAPDMFNIHSSPHFQSTLSDYEHILKICRAGEKIPELTYRAATDILLSLKAEVNDFYSITANHFINAGKAGFEHFFFLINALVKNVNLASLEELNTIWACILHKGHGKNKNSDRSYRTISTCPLLAKALDTYVGQLYGGGWANVQAPTQFQGSGSSHELAALLLTECIQHSLYTDKEPVFAFMLNAESAFDKVVRQWAIRNGRDF